MSKYFEQYLKKNNFNKWLKSLNNKIKNKTIIIYGSGMMFQYIKANYDLSKFNIIGISDAKYSTDSEGKESMGYKIIPKEKIKEYSPDYILVAIENYINIIEDFEMNVFKSSKIKILPLVKKNFIDIIKIIWQEI